MYDDDDKNAPLFWLKQALCHLDEDYVYDFGDPWNCLEDWFHVAEPSRKVLEHIVLDVDRLFDTEPDHTARAAHFGRYGWNAPDFDVFLRDLQRRAQQELDGSPVPMRDPIYG
jgi:hypothetical protein